MHVQAVLTSIVLKRNVTMLDIVSTRMLGQFGFLARVSNAYICVNNLQPPLVLSFPVALHFKLVLFRFLQFLRI